MFLDLGWPEPTLALCVNRMHDCEARKKSPEDYPKVRGIPRKSHGFGISVSRAAFLLSGGGAVFSQVDS